MAKAKYPGTCQCGVSVPAGASITPDRIKGKFTIVACAACHPEEHAGVAPSPPMELRIRVSRVRYTGQDRFLIVEATLDGTCPPVEGMDPVEAGQTFSVKGPLGPKAATGDLVDVYGNWQSDAKYGWGFVAMRSTPVVGATDAGLIAFLGRFPNVGRRRAQGILQALGSREAVLEALEKNPQALVVVDGITEARAALIGAEYMANIELKDADIFLRGLDLGEAFVAQLLETYEGSAKQVLLEDPYQLMELPGVGFKTADDIAKKLGIGSEDPRRLAAAVLHLLKSVEQQGHTWSTANDLLAVY